MKKVTKAALNSLIKKNSGKLYINTTAKFDGMTDFLEFDPNKQFDLLEKTDSDAQYKYNLGYKGIWVTRTPGDNSYTHYEDDNFTGIEVYNCFRKFIVAIKRL